MVAPAGLEKLALPVGVATFLKSKWGITELYPPQAESMPSVLSGRNTLLAIPTASGKSLVAYLAILKKLLVDEPGSRAVYIVPLKALATEKYEELKEIAETFGLRVGLGIGDRSGETMKLDEGDILVCTSEKLDSLMRTKPELVGKVSIVIADELHLIHDSSRGPTMEVNLTRLRHWRPGAQIIALSATVNNATDLAGWLGAELISSDWRPVTLEMSTLVEGCVEPRKRIEAALNPDEIKLPAPRQLAGPASSPTWSVLLDTVQHDAQMLLFVSTRRSAQAEARKLSERLSKHLSKEEPARIEGLVSLAERISRNADSAMGDALVKSVKGGVAFHHAGLTSTQRKLVEDGFKRGLLCAICATPTLAAGVNLPARRVLVRDLKRWDDGFNRLLPVMEVQQMLGRAGRPSYDTIGEAWLMCKGDKALDEADIVAEKYIHGPPENVVSKLNANPPMRVHLLSGIATGGLTTRQGIRSFFQSTYLGHSIASHVLEDRIDNMLNWLLDEEFIIRVGVEEELARKYEVELEKKTPADENAWDDELPFWAASAESTAGVNLSVRAEVGINANVGRDSEGADENRQGHATPRRSVHTQPTLGFRQASEFEMSEDMPVLAKTNDPPAMTYAATPFGHRTAQLYIDPLSASTLRIGLRRAVRRLVRMKDGMEVSQFGLLFLAASTPDFLSFWAKDSERDNLHVKGSTEEDGQLIDIPLEDRFLGLVKSAWVMQNWTDEVEMRNIERKHGISPGDLRNRLDLMEWLLYSAKELAEVDDVFAGKHDDELMKLMIMLQTLANRVRHGCKEDLLDLVRLRNVGRARARTLRDFGVRTPKDLLKLSEADLQRLTAVRGWGPLLLERIISDVNRTLGWQKDAKKVERDDDEPLPGERMD